MLDHRETARSSDLADRGDHQPQEIEEGDRNPTVCFPEALVPPVPVVHIRATVRERLRQQTKDLWGVSPRNCGVYQRPAAAATKPQYARVVQRPP